jgi:serine/threonine protein kinase
MLFAPELASAAPDATLDWTDTQSPSARPSGHCLDLRQLIPGSVLGKYQILNRIGRGSTSAVFSGIHRKLRIPVAIKVLDLESHRDSAELRQRLLSEAVLLARLTHQNIVRLWDIDDEGPYPYLVLEYVSGPSLAELIAKRGPISAQLAFAIVRQAAEGLAQAHSLNIVHRDVKPGNLLLSPEGVVKLADLGLGVVLNKDVRRAAAPEAFPPGTAAYLAPELAQDPSAADFRADIYSLGATLYHALTGRPPFAGRSPLEVIGKHVNQAPTPPERHASGIPSACSEVVLRMLAKRPEDRFGSYDLLRNALGQAVGDRRAPRPLAEAFLEFACK